MHAFLVELENKPGELARVTEAPYGPDVRDVILGGTLARLLEL